MDVEALVSAIGIAFTRCNVMLCQEVIQLNVEQSDLVFTHYKWIRNDAKPLRFKPFRTKYLLITGKSIEPKRRQKRSRRIYGIVCFCVKSLHHA